MENTQPDLTHFGKPRYFDLGIYIEAAKQLSKTNLIFAMEMLQKPPAYYLDNPTPELIQAKKELESMLKDFDPVADKGQRPDGFDLDNWIKAMEGMICADEFSFAMMRMYENSPKFYFNTHSPALYKFKRWAWEKLISDQEYAEGEVEVNAQPPSREAFEHQSNYRFHIVDQIIEMYNNKGKTPFIVDFGPAAYQIVHGARMRDRRIAYKGITFRNLKEKPPEWQEKQAFDQPSIFVAMEILEHLWNPDIIYQYCVKELFDPDFVVISTPKHTFGGGVDHRRSQYHGHINTFTPQKLLDFGRRHWPLYTAKLADGPQMVLVLQKEGYLEERG